ncbi:MAG: branched-chain amino acid transport system II carrier protein [Lactobacillus sp.]|jgi:LIVCS family branched-chain amino acid:cation transporter|nr:branched-chain amino acid transport system II carrier protein [Lactobacillus sp.]MCH4068576.1 branched-chain amino acid transport system II carrier protein [Lactobacillus sp.]MCI1304129.1 branched-chain amino acid transport system II carrier protein [Lactobacillus sp.]MCI1330286.1 branched-chain amino acid transport system II carrier protein [Lactobacillus sp.]MCI1358967.1 branched-chain amino acid transport system II carrier protein [Lactobacillus sp.]
MQTDNPKMKVRDYLVIASMIFALFFGAGNLIFPLHLGQLAGRNWPQAVIGFIVTGVVLPLLSVLAIAITRSRSFYEVCLPLGSICATIFLILIHATIGPLFGTPRTATVSFTVGIAPFLPKNMQQFGLLAFSAIFFVLTFWVAYNQSDILSKLGKILNPVFLILLLLVFVVAFCRPLGNPANFAPTAKIYAHRALTQGFLEGYNTMDALAGLAFGVAIVTAIRSLGQRGNKRIAVITAKSGALAMLLVGLIYLLLTIVGAMSLGQFKASADGGVVFSQVVQAYAGMWGQAVLAVLMTVTCLTTAVGLVAAFSEDFQKHFPILNYHQWLAVSCFASFLTANIGLEKIIRWSLPVLMFMYPLAIGLIILSVFSPLFKRDRVVYLVTMVFTLMPAILDLIVSMPAVVSQSAFGKAVAQIRLTYLPLANVGLSWVMPMAVGLVIGVILHLIRRRKNYI